MAKESARRWTEVETKRALYLYFQLPFGKIHSRNPDIIELAEAINRTPSSIAMKLANFASLDPKITDTGRAGLPGASALDRKIWIEFNNDWTRLIAEAAALNWAVPRTDEAEDTVKSVREAASDFNFKPFAGQSTKSAFVEQRLGQAFFRRAVIANYDEKCCVTGIADVRLLNASHIMPWAVDEQNRHNPRNGLCLSATFDRAFDRGLMCIDDSGRSRFSASLLDHAGEETRTFFSEYEGRLLHPAQRLSPDPNFLKWHRDHRFKANGDEK